MNELIDYETLSSCLSVLLSLSLSTYIVVVYLIAKMCVSRYVNMLNNALRIIG